MRRSLVAGVVLVLALGACGSEVRTASKVSTAALVAGAADAAADAGTAKIEGEVSVHVAGNDATIPVEGAVDLRGGAMTMSMDGSGFGLPGNGKLEIRLVDGVMYMDLASLSGEAKLPLALRERPWVRYELPADAQATSGTQNFGDQLQALRGAGEVEKKGTEEVRGVETTHYRAQVDIAAALRKAHVDEQPELRAALEAFPEKLPMDVWLDDAGRPRRMTIDVEMTVEGKTAALAERIDFFDFGTSVDISAPPADETMSMQELQALGAD